MSKILSTLAAQTSIGMKVKRTIDASPEFSGVQRSDTGRPDRQISPGGFLTG